MQEKYYEKLRALFDQKQPDLSTIKYLTPKQSLAHSAFNTFLQQTIRPYLSAMHFVKVLSQNLFDRLSDNDYRFRNIQEAAKGVFSESTLKALKYLCYRKTQAAKFEKYLTDQYELGQVGFEKKVRQLILENKMFTNWMVATATYVKNSQLTGQQQKSYEQFKNKRHQLQKQSSNFPFYLLQSIQEYKNSCILLKSALDQYQRMDNSIKNLSFEAKVQKMIENYTKTYKQIPIVANDIRKMIDSLKRQKCSLNSSRYNPSVNNKEVKQLLNKLFQQICSQLKQCETKYSQELAIKIQKLKSSTISLEPQIKQGIKYQQLLQFVDSLHNKLYSEIEVNIAKKMDKINQHFQRQSQKYPFNNQEAAEQSQILQRLQNNYNQSLDANQQLKVQLQSVNMQNYQLDLILKEILTILTNKNQQFIVQTINIRAYQCIPQKITKLLLQAEQRQKAKQNTQTRQSQQSNYLDEQNDTENHRMDEKLFQEKQETIKQLQTKLQEVSKKLSNLQIAHERLVSVRQNEKLEQNQKILQLQNDIQQKKNSIQRLGKEKIQQEIKIQNLQMNVGQINKQLIQMSDKMIKENEIHDIQVQKLKQNLQRFKKKSEDELIKVKIQAAEETNKQISETKESHQEEISFYQRQKNNLLLQLQDYKKKYYEQVGLKLFANSIEQQLQEAKATQIRELQLKYNQKFQKEVQAALRKVQILQEQSGVHKKQKEQLVTKLSTKIEEIVKLNQKVAQIQSQLLTSKLEKDQLQKQYDRLMDASKVIQKTIMRHQNQDSLYVLQELQAEQAIKKAAPNLLVSYTKALFNEEIFENSQLQKEILVQHLERYACSKISRTRLIYKYDIRNKINFHQYIDDIKGLLLVIKTKNAIIAGFYPQALKDKQILNKGGLLVSVTNDKSYRLLTKKPGDTSGKSIFRGMIYDTFFAIYGNAEIRIKTGFKTVFSNFGVSNSYFDNRGDKVQKFLNEGDKREVQFQFCQFYQVLFENPTFTQ